MAGTFRLDKSSTISMHLPVPVTKVINILFTLRLARWCTTRCNPLSCLGFLSLCSDKNFSIVRGGSGLKTGTSRKAKTMRLFCTVRGPNGTESVEKVVSLTDYQPLCVTRNTFLLSGWCHTVRCGKGSNATSFVTIYKAVKSSQQNR